SDPPVGRRASRSAGQRSRKPPRRYLGRGPADRRGHRPRVHIRADDGERVIRTYRALLVAQIQAAAQYRVQSILWMLFSVIRPVIFLAAWVAVANAQGGQIGAYDTRDFAGYYVALALVTNLVFSWNAYDFEFEIRMGRLSPKLLRPLHPI